MKQNSKRSFKSTINYKHLHDAMTQRPNSKQLQDEATEFLKKHGFTWNGKERIVNK